MMSFRQSESIICALGLGLELQLELGLELAAEIRFGQTCFRASVVDPSQLRACT